jgi:uncharacterized protein YndB with AHSA1/START domain
MTPTISYETSFNLEKDKEVIITRLFDAPRDLVYQTYTDPAMIPKWWGPRSLSTTVEKMEVKPGGQWRFVSQSPEGQVHAFHGEYKEVVPNQKLAWTFEYEGAPGHVSNESVVFEDKGGKTLVTIKAVYGSKEARDGMVKNGMEWGLRESMFRLEEELARKAAGKPFLISRVFNAPRELVFKTWTEPEHFAKWFGPKGCQVRVARFEPRPGGIALTSLATPDGHTMWGKLIYREVAAPERLVYITTFSDEQGGLTRHPMSATWPFEMLTTVTFHDEDGRTRLTVEWVPLHATPEELATFTAALDGMSGGWGGSFDQLEAYLAEIKG